MLETMIADFAGLCKMKVGKKVLNFRADKCPFCIYSEKSIHFPIIFMPFPQGIRLLFSSVLQKNRKTSCIFRTNRLYYKQSHVS